MIFMAFWTPTPLTEVPSHLEMPPLASRYHQWSPGPAAAWTSELGIELV